MKNDYYARRQYLVSVFEDTMMRIGKDATLQAAVLKSLDSQVFIPEKETITLPKYKYEKPAKVIVTRNRTFEAAANYRGQHVAVLNFASSTSPGGGVTGGASAQEECLCRVSTLYPCLKSREMWQMFYEPHRKTGNAMHNDDIIFTPDVLVFKDDDYNPLDAPFVADVITCAAPNLRESPSNPYNPHDGCQMKQIRDDDLLVLHIRRATKILSVAAAKGVEVLILGAFGCGAFRNNPDIVSEAYRRVLPDYMHYFKTIEFAVYCRPSDMSNYLAFENKFGNIN